MLIYHPAYAVALTEETELSYDFSLSPLRGCSFCLDGLTQLKTRSRFQWKAVAIALRIFYDSTGSEDPLNVWLDRGQRNEDEESQ